MKGFSLILMAAGRGSRLGNLTEHTSKAMISVAQRPLIGHSLQFAKWLQADSRIVVGGYCYDELVSYVTAVDSDARLIENTELHRGNLLSLVAGQTLLGAGDAFLLMNVDHIYPRGVAKLVRKAAAEAEDIVAFCDFDRKLGADDMKVQLDAEQRVVSMSKTLETWDAGYVGMTFIPAACRQRYDAAVAAVRADSGDDSAVEQILVQLSESGSKPAIVDISGFGWLEVDDPSERAVAERALASSEVQTVVSLKDR